MRSFRHAALASLTLGIAAFVAQSCGSDGGSTFGPGTPCATIYDGQCGAPCSTDESCPKGLYCGSGKTCQADCAPNFACGGPGLTCTARGRCDVGGGASFGDGGTSDTDAACIDLTVDLAKVVPTIALLVDQSSSMSASFGGGTRWDVVRDVLMNPDGGVVRSLEGDVVFGLHLYTREGPFPQTFPQCPRVVSVASASGNYQAMADLYYDAGPIQGTPTGESVDRLIGRRNGVIGDAGFAAQRTPGPKVIVLATDGEPDVCVNGDDEDAGRRVALDAIAAAHAAGIPTYVIGVGGQIGQTRLKEMANAGAGQPIDTGDASPFSTSDRAEFVGAMNTITFGVRSCVFTLGGQVEPGQESRGTVILDDQPLGLDDPDGWRLNGPSELEVRGRACNTIKTKPTAKLTVRFPCGAFDVR